MLLEKALFGAFFLIKAGIKTCVVLKQPEFNF